MQNNFQYIDTIPTDIMDEIQRLIKVSYEFLELPETTIPLEKVKAIYEFVEQCIGLDLSDKIIITLGCFWADAVIEQYGWSWKYLGDTEDDMLIYIVSPKGYYSCNPISFIEKIIKGKNIGPNGSNDNTILLLFNMLENIEDTIPERKYWIIG